MATKGPSSLTIRTYAVGFGDCFLLSFEYARGEKHVLIDFGSTATPKAAPKDQVLRIARDIAKVTDGKLHAVVATHRHADHISGFTTNAKGDGPGDIIRALAPDVVVQPWTEDPKARQDAKKATRSSQSGAAKLRLAKLRAIEVLDGMHEVAAAAERAGKRPGHGLSPEVAAQLAFIGEDNVKNLLAVKNLMSMPGAKRTYVNAGSKSGLESVLPGVKIHVLGPPNLEQTDSIRKQTASDEDDFWQFWSRQGLASASAIGPGAKLFPREVATEIPPALRWFQQRLGTAFGDELLRLVTILDQQMNNTSVILLFEIGSKRLLFPGDAQLENWAFALSQPAVRKLLSGTTLYKVGHHGSLNATPKKQLWPLFRKRSKKKNTAGRLLTLLSTREDKHGHVQKKTEVPRSTLVEELARESTLLSTLDYAADELCRTTVVKFGTR